MHVIPEQTVQFDAKDLNASILEQEIEVPAGSLVSVEVIVTEAAIGTAPTLVVGDGVTADLFHTTVQSAPKVLGVKDGLVKNFYSANGKVKATLDLDDDVTKGKFVLCVTAKHLNLCGVAGLEP